MLAISSFFFELFQGRRLKISEAGSWLNVYGIWNVSSIRELLSKPSRREC